MTRPPSTAAHLGERSRELLGSIFHAGRAAGELCSAAANGMMLLPRGAFDALRSRARRRTSSAMPVVGADRSTRVDMQARALLVSSVDHGSKEAVLYKQDEAWVPTESGSRYSRAVPGLDAERAGPSLVLYKKTITHAWVAHVGVGVGVGPCENPQLRSV